MTHIQKMTFKRPLMALSMAASIALSPMAITPANAGGSNNGRLLAGLVALGLIGVIIENEAGRRSGGNHYDDTAYDIPPSKRLPSRCVKSYNSTRGAKTMVSGDCLRDTFRYWNSMPRQCAVTVQYRGNHNTYRSEKAYRLGCLDDWGYSIVSDY